MIQTEQLPDQLPLASDAVFDEQRTGLIQKVEQPYLVHFMGGVEGENLNPEGAEHNFDASLMLTGMIHDRDLFTRSVDRLGPDTDWFFDKYPESDLQPRFLRKPTAVVTKWLEKLGPHNDLAGAEGDLRLARQWIIDSEAEKTGTSMYSGAKSFGLVADLDLELAEILTDGDERESVLLEAISHLEQAKISHMDEGRVGDACVDQTKLAYAKIELRRQQLFGETALKTPGAHLADEELEELQEVYVQEITTLDQDIHTALDILEIAIDDAHDEGLEEIDKDFKKNFGLLYEAFTYTILLADILENDRMASAKARIGTIRQESGTSHKVYVPGEAEDQGKKVYNFNYDLAYDQARNAAKDGYIETVFIQSKLDAYYARHEDSVDMTERFFGNKKFQYATPLVIRGFEDIHYQGLDTYTQAEGMMNQFREALDNKIAVGPAKAMREMAVANQVDISLVEE